MILQPISIVIPTRARDESLVACLERLRPQIADAEVIVTDDGASQTTRQLVESRFEFVRWTAGPQRGPAANRNHGASLATREFVVFLDDDVEPSAALISSYLAAIQPGVDIYEGRTTCHVGLHSPLELSPINEKGGVLWSCNMMIRRSVLASVGGFDEDFPYPHFEDVAFRERLKQYGASVIFVSEASVDHPPRRIPSPRALAMCHESFFTYHYKYLNQRPVLGAFLLHFFSHRVRYVLTFPLSRDSAVALASMWVEAGHVLWHWRSWDRKWRGSRQQSLP